MQSNIIKTMMLIIVLYVVLWTPRYAHCVLMNIFTTFKLGGIAIFMIVRILPGARRRGIPRTAWIDNFKTWTGFPAEESIRMTQR